MHSHIIEKEEEQSRTLTIGQSHISLGRLDPTESIGGIVYTTQGDNGNVAEYKDYI